MAPHRFSSLPRTHRWYPGNDHRCRRLQRQFSIKRSRPRRNPQRMGHSRRPDASEWVGSDSALFNSRSLLFLCSETFVFMSSILFRAICGDSNSRAGRRRNFLWSFKRGQKLFKVVFNVCALPLTIWSASHLLFAVGGITPLFGSRHSIDLQKLLGSGSFTLHDCIFPAKQLAHNFCHRHDERLTFPFEDLAGLTLLGDLSTTSAAHLSRH